MSDDRHLAEMSKRTHDGYLRAVRQLADYTRRAPDQISEDQLRRFFLHLRNEKQFATGSLRVAFSGIKFFYTRTCRREWQTLAHMKVPNVKSLPEVITIEKVQQIIDHCTTRRMAVYFWTVYSLGMRMDEALHLQVGDIDSARMMVHVHRGKGAKDRYIPLPESTLQTPPSVARPEARRVWPAFRSVQSCTVQLGPILTSPATPIGKPLGVPPRRVAPAGRLAGDHTNESHRRAGRHEVDHQTAQLR